MRLTSDLHRRGFVHPQWNNRRTIFPGRCLRQHDQLTIGELHHLLLLRLRQHGLSPARSRKGARASGVEEERASPVHHGKLVLAVGFHFLYA